VLRAILEKDFLYTLKYLCARTFDVSKETIRLYLGTQYENAMKPEIEPSEFEILANELRKARIKYSPMITSEMIPNVSYMIRSLEERSNEFGIDFPVLPISTMNVREMMSLLPQLVKTIPASLSDTGLEQIAERFNLHQDLIKFASNLKIELLQVSESFTPVPEDAYNQYEFPQRMIPTLGNTVLVHYNRERSLENTKTQTVLPIGSSAQVVEDYVA